MEASGVKQRRRLISGQVQARMEGAPLRLARALLLETVIQGRLAPAQLERMYHEYCVRAHLQGQPAAGRYLASALPAPAGAGKVLVARLPDGRWVTLEPATGALELREQAPVQVHARCQLRQ